MRGLDDGIHRRAFLEVTLRCYPFHPRLPLLAWANGQYDLLARGVRSAGLVSDEACSAWWVSTPAWRQDEVRHEQSTHADRDISVRRSRRA